jgi:hypothetical protein
VSDKKDKPMGYDLVDETPDYKKPWNEYWKEYRERYYKVYGRYPPNPREKDLNT